MSEAKPSAPGEARAAGQHAKHILSLDGLRGVAALAVVSLHYASLHGYQPALPGATLAVDFFFMLSGFVLSFAYSERLERRSFLPRYLVLRVIRLAPLMVLGGALGLVSLPFGDDSYHPASLALNFVGLPTPFEPGHGAYLLNPPAWSLSCELAVSIAFGILAPWLGRRTGLILAASSAVLLFLAITQAGGMPVFEKSAMGMAGLVARTVGPFMIGVLLQRHARLRPVNPEILALVLLASFAMTPGTMPIVVVATVYLLYPALIGCAAASPVTAWIAPLARFSGFISFPVYAIHFPMLLMLRPLLPGMSWLAYLLTMVIIVAAAWCAGTWFDKPLAGRMRASFERSMLRRRAAADGPPLRRV